MKTLLSTFYKVIIPTAIKNRISLIREVPVNRILRKEILQYYHSSEICNSAEVSEVLSYLKNHPLAVIPYEFQHDYFNLKVKVLYDNLEDLPFVYWGRYRLYFRKDWSETHIQQIFKSLLIEQDARSPHSYVSSEFDVNENDIIADIGAAEGIFTLSVIDKVNMAFIFEADEHWIKPLYATFRPWSDKVTIIKKYVSDTNDLTQITLDSYFKSEGVDFLKIDVEGGELRLLKGSTNLMKFKKLKIAICTYHKHEDAQVFSKYFHEKGFDTTFSQGFMVYIFDKELTKPYLRRGLIRAIKVIKDKTPAQTASK